MMYLLSIKRKNNVKTALVLCVTIFMLGCASAPTVQTTKNPDHAAYRLTKTAVVTVAASTTAGVQDQIAMDKLLDSIDAGAVERLQRSGVQPYRTRNIVKLSTSQEETAKKVWALGASEILIIEVNKTPFFNAFAQGEIGFEANVLARDNTVVWRGYFTYPLSTAFTRDSSAVEPIITSFAQSLVADGLIPAH